MKCVILFAIFVGLVACSDGAAVQNAALRGSMSQGAIRPGDRLLHSALYFRSPIVNVAQYQDITYQGDSDVRISYLAVTEVGQTQWALPMLRAGGVGENNVTIRISSVIGGGYYYLVEIWGQ